jgi:multicomponent Na+:H+ antiporter subunit G
VLLGLIVIPFLIVSFAFNLLGVISLYRFPDVYTRLHGATKCTTFGTLFSVLALMFYSFVRYVFGSGEARFMVLFIHVIIAAAVLLITNPTGAQVLARAAHRSGTLPEPALVDALEEAEKAKGGAAA